MDSSDKQQRRFLLSIDGGGGRRGCLSLLIIQEILQQVQMHRPGTQAYNIFDLAGGTGAGGLIVIMLFRLQMDIVTAISDYHRLTNQVGSAPTAGIVNTVEGSRSARLGLCFRTIIKRRKDNVEEGRSRLVRFFKAPIMVNQSLISKAFTCALQRRNPPPDPDFFISWEKRENNWDKITIIDAAKATCAFCRAGAVTIKDRDNAKKTFNGNPLSDPHSGVLREAQSIFNKRTVLIAIGAGEREAVRVNDGDNIRFDFKCDVMDGWRQGDNAGELARGVTPVIGQYLPDNATDLIKDFVKLYLEESPALSEEQ